MSNRQVVLNIVVAEPRHIVGIVETLRKARTASATPYPEEDEVYCMQSALDLIAQGFVAVAVSKEWNGDRVVGCLMLDYARWPWCHPSNPKGYHLTNQHFWVEPDHRNGGTAHKLLTFAKEVADRKQLPLKLEFTSMTTARPEVRDRFARISGLSYTGGVFYREPKV